MTEIQVREATVADAPEIGRIHVEMWQDAYRGQMSDSVLNSLSIPQRTQNWATILRNPRTKSHILVAIDGEHTVGFCSVGTCRDEDAPEATGEVYAIYIDPRFKGKGIGSALIAEGVRQLREEGFTRATLWVLASNTQALGFYKRQGWAADGKNRTEVVSDVELHEVRYAIKFIPNSDSGSKD